ncbi:MAG: methyltransferase domain-containing protein [Verrucomicrobiaceae bacterium]|jgi:spermidine synthase|nr:MAG: methyltransferase domain-containing protein [Verrucomicrobiaceae bacterium]
MRRTETVHTSHQSLEIWKSDLATEFRVAGAIHASFHRKRFLTGLAWDMIAASALLGKHHPPRSVLMLGLAGGTAFRILRHLLPDCRLTAIDIDPEIVSLARQHMALDELGIEVILGDAYPWLAESRRTFDVVFDDIYLAGKTDVFRPRAWDPALLENLRRAVAPGGVLAVNLVTGAGHRTMQSLTRRILTGNFPVVRAIKSAEAMNEVLVAGDSVATGSRLRPYRDAFADWRDCAYWDRLEVRRVQPARRFHATSSR